MVVNQLQRMSNNSTLFTFFATLGGVILGVLLSVAITGPMLSARVAEATQNAAHTITTQPASYTAAACTVPAGQSTPSGAGGTTVASTQPTPESGGRGGEPVTPPSGDKTWVHKFVSGVWATNTATISDTGSDSENTVTTVNRNTTRVHNDNNIQVVNTNPQTASSGDVEAHDNTGAGAASSGAASNASKAEFDVTLVN